MATKFEEKKSVITRLNTRYFEDLCVQHAVLGVGLLNDVTQILPRPTLVAMATKFFYIIVDLDFIFQWVIAYDVA